MTVGEVLRQMRALPVCDVQTVLGAHPALILAPHPDDESLGCGGLIAAACDHGRPPVLAFITDGTGSHPRSRLFRPDRLRATREEEAWAAAGQLNLARERITFMRLRDGAAPYNGVSFDRAVDTISSTASRWKCGSILAPWRHDPHTDHLATHLMAKKVAAHLHLRHLSYPVWGWTLPPSDPMDETVRGVRLDISQYLPAKHLAIAAHVSQHGGLITDDPHGFWLPAGLLSVFDEPYEVFLENV